MKIAVASLLMQFSRQALRAGNAGYPNVSRTPSAGEEIIFILMEQFFLGKTTNHKRKTVYEVSYPRANLLGRFTIIIPDSCKA